MDGEKDSQHYQRFIQSVKDAAPAAVLFLPGTVSKSKSTSSEVLGSVIDAADQCHSVQDLLTRLHLSSDQIKQIERLTVGQSTNEQWLELRKGRITASNFYRVFTKIESLKKDPKVSCDKLVNSFVNPADLSHLTHIQEGSRKESLAVDALKEELTSAGHRNVVILECGLYIDHTRAYLGASPDGIATCDCCEESRLVEIKCPTVK